jgi:hypothetical protein
MHATVPTDRERAAVQAYLRLLSTVRAALDTEGHTAPGPRPPHPVPTPDTTDHTPCAAPPPLVPPSLLADADACLAAAGLAGNEGEFFALLRAWCPGVGTQGEEPTPPTRSFGA